MANKNILAKIQHAPYFYQYVQKIIERKQITYQIIEPGMVIDLFYNKELPYGFRVMKRYIVFVLSTKKVPGHNGRFIYGLSLEHIPPANFTRLINLIGLDAKSAKLYKAKKVMYPKAMIPENSNPKNIYDTYIRPKLDTLLKDSYRQFKRENIVKVYAVDFEWSKVLVNKYLIENKININDTNETKSGQSEIDTSKD